MNASFIESLKTKPVSKKYFNVDVDISPDSSKVSSKIAFEEPKIEFVDESENITVKQKFMFKEKIRQMRNNRLLTVKVKRKTKKSMAPAEPIKKFTSTSDAPTMKMSTQLIPEPGGESKVSKVDLKSIAIEKMQEIAEKRRLKKEKRERRRMAKLLKSKTQMEKRQSDRDKASYLSRKADITFKAAPYYLNNREAFINFITDKVYKIKKSKGEENEIKSCADLNASKTGNFSLLLHQEIVKDYLNIYSPYRGLFLYFGLGAGKTCASIAIAEGLKDYHKIVVMTPASLEKNYMTELKFCGDDIFKKNHYWEFIKNTPANQKQIEELTRILNIPVAIVRKHDGIWAMNTSPPSASGNYKDLSESQQKQLNTQLDALIKNKYEFIHYNGLRNIDKYEAAGLKNGGNYFNNKVVIIDEVHNFVGTISNQIGNESSFNYKLYNYLMDAENCRIVFLTGTPIINYPNEIGIFFNMLRGRIKTYEFKLNTSSSSRIKRLNIKILKKILYSKNNEINHIEFNNTNKKLVITRNPFQFINRYKKVTDQRDKKSIVNIDVIRKEDSEFAMFRNDGSYESAFIKNIINSLEKYGITISRAQSDDCENRKNKSDPKYQSKDIYEKVCIKKYKCLPDDYDSFVAKFIDPNTQEIINKNIFKKRIMGLTSYFRSATESLLPSFNPATDIDEVFIPMSSYQISVYNKIRNIEINKEKSSNLSNRLKTTNDLYKKSSAAYKIYSRECCNIAFPEDIPRPRPIIKKKKDEDNSKEKTKEKTKGTTKKSKTKQKHGESKAMDKNAFTEEAIMNAAKIDSDEPKTNIEGDTLSSIDSSTSADIDTFEDKTYSERVSEALEQLNTNKDTLFVGDNLQKYSPKFNALLRKLNEQIVNKDSSTSDGTNLIYSFYNNVEGLGIFKMVMEANGYAQFKISNKNPEKQWKIDMNAEDLQKPCFILYSGNEDTDEKEYLRLIFNSDWDKLPDTLRKQLLSIRNRFLPPEDETTITNNFHGEIIKVFMITAAGAEGITLKNVRAVHLMEPFWHPVRFEQVIGRAVRICSHEQLEEKEQSVKVYIYLMTFTEKQLKGNPEGKDEIQKKPIVSTLIINNDISKVDPNKVITSDEKLYEISNMKKKVNASILKVIKETSIDCKVHKKAGSDLQCFTMNFPKSDEYLFNPNLDKDAPGQVEEISFKLVPIRDPNDSSKKYYLKKENDDPKDFKGKLYDYNAWKKYKQLVYIGESD